MTKENRFRDFASRLRGPLLLPGDDGYENARKVFNAMIDKRPAAIARCAGAADVIHCVNFAREHQLVVSVRGGGHNVAGKAVCDDGLMIDLSQMKGIRVDPARRLARAQPGLTLGDFDHETQAFDLATTLGIFSPTGIAGLTLGGGLGWLMGKYGLACDNVLSFDVVTADGRVLTASAEENSDLYWGLRGGGGNFGIVTSFEYRLHPVGPTVLAGGVAYPMEKAREVFRFFRDFARTCPDELTVQGGIGPAANGQIAAVLDACYCGPLDGGEKAVKSLRTAAAPLADYLGPMPYLETQRMLDHFLPWGRYNYWKANFLRELPDAAIDIFVECGSSAPSSLSTIWFEAMGGAAARVDAAATAFAHRHYPFNFALFTHWENPADNEKNIAWTRRWWDAMQPFMAAGSYINYLEEEGDPRARATFGANYERLAALKRKYDPDNFFRLNQNIVPARASG